MILQPWSLGHGVRAIHTQINDLGDLEPSPDPMLRPADKAPATIVLHRLKQPPKDEQVSRLDPLVCEMSLGRAHLS
jgi:hypothetical protein